jgi:hypothetical protein
MAKAPPNPALAVALMLIATLFPYGNIVFFNL